jgi:phosphinothricin acetyltransferase
VNSAFDEDSAPDVSPRSAPPVAGITIRSAHAADAVHVIAIRTAAIRESTALWIDEVPSSESSAAWFESHRAGGTLLVAVQEDDVDGEERADAEGSATVLGYANVSALRDYSGYRFTGEDSVYLTPRAQGKGLGRALLEALVKRSTDLGWHSLCAFVEASNTASIALHLRCGFTEVGRIPQAGTKFGRWLDLVILQRLL